MTEDEIRNRRMIRENVTQRVRVGQPHTGSVVACVDRIFDISDRFHVRKSEIEADQKLSTVGRRAALAQIVRSELMPDLAKATRPVRKALSYAAAQRAALEDPVRVDPTDPVGEMRRQEIRTFMRSLQPHERMSTANQLIRDDAGAAAILDAPPALSGLTEHFYGELRNQVAERVNGPKLTELSGIEQDYQQGQAAADILMNDLVAASGLTAKGFAEEMQPLQTEADA
ncbi:hypothetical protein SAMN02799622_02027 [Methylobacterium sp. UNC378MF]|uniref:hypothetical protein n=1 Tax=Methylobacterium sp. UNC378MF TaxID=1502748 RepID=UPI0008813B75|nr:hypothetical protein [Methylobacterium sp. UNC378MF]SDA18426.1 hypothetical protein SAMN02799622_02027 [Methylobacterium sp. UNC378MF]